MILHFFFLPQVRGFVGKYSYFFRFASFARILLPFVFHPYSRCLDSVVWIVYITHCFTLLVLDFMVYCHTLLFVLFCLKIVYAIHSVWDILRFHVDFSFSYCYCSTMMFFAVIRSFFR